MFDDNKFLKGTRFTFHYELIITLCDARNIQ